MATKKPINQTKTKESKTITPQRTVDFRLVKKTNGEYALFGYLAQNKAWVELPTTIL